VDYGRRGLFRRDVVHAVHDVSFALPRERVLAIVGESGSGKSTLARTLLRLQRKVAGAITFEGQDVFALAADALRRFRQRVQIVFQNPASSLNPRKTVGELVTRPLLLAGVPTELAGERAATMLAAVGIDKSMVARRPRELSGGEKQRVAIARAFVTEPVLVILDEPTTSLDASVQASILELLDRLKIERRCAYLLITHDLAVVRQAADDVIVMQAGEIRESGPVDAVFSDPQHPYTRSLMSAAHRS
jgi:ABC-type glutathione transport system ATPase component